MRVLLSSEQETLINALRIAADRCTEDAAKVAGPLNAMLLQSAHEYRRLLDVIDTAPAVAVSEEGA